MKRALYLCERKELEEGGPETMFCSIFSEGLRAACGSGAGDGSGLSAALRAPGAEPQILRGVQALGALHPGRSCDFMAGLRRLRPRDRLAGPRSDR